MRTKENHGQAYQRRCQLAFNMVENLLTVTRIRDDSASVNKSLEPVEEVMAEAAYRLKRGLRMRRSRYFCPKNL